VDLDLALDLDLDSYQRIFSDAETPQNQQRL